MWNPRVHNVSCTEMQAEHSLTLRMCRFLHLLSLPKESRRTQVKPHVDASTQTRDSSYLVATRDFTRLADVVCQVYEAENIGCRRHRASKGVLPLGGSSAGECRAQNEDHLYCVNVLHRVKEILCRDIRAVPKVRRADGDENRDPAGSSQYF